MYVRTKFEIYSLPLYQIFVRADKVKKVLFVAHCSFCTCGQSLKCTLCLYIKFLYVRTKLKMYSLPLYQIFVRADKLWNVLSVAHCSFCTCRESLSVLQQVTTPRMRSSLGKRLHYNRRCYLVHHCQTELDATCRAEPLIQEWLFYFYFAI